MVSYMVNGGKYVYHCSPKPCGRFKHVHQRFLINFEVFRTFWMHQRIPNLYEVLHSVPSINTRIWLKFGFSTSMYFHILSK